MKSHRRVASKFTTHTDHQGRRIVRLDVGRGQTAVLTRADWQRAQRLFGKTWYVTGNGSGLGYVAAARPGNDGLITLARVVFDAAAGERVKYRDGNRLNLLPENLYTVTGAAKRPAVEPMRAAA